jgi:threonine aldolase
LPALSALEGFEARFTAARLASARLFAGLVAAGGYALRPVEHGSNIAFLEIAPERAAGLGERLRNADIHMREPRTAGCRSTSTRRCSGRMWMG